MDIPLEVQQRVSEEKKRRNGRKERKKWGRGGRKEGREEGRKLDPFCENTTTLSRPVVGPMNHPRVQELLIPVK